MQSLARGAQSLATGVQNFAADARDRYNNSGKDLIVLFSHSARIRCFLKMMYPYSSRGNVLNQSIYDILGDKKFFNSVSFKLASTSQDNIFLLTMIHEGHKVQDGKRLNKQQFYEKIREKTGENVNGNEIRVYIKSYEESDKATGIPLDTGYGLNMLLSDNKDIIIIRHGHSTHNSEEKADSEEQADGEEQADSEGKRGGEGLRGGWVTTDTSLTKEGFQATVEVARQLVDDNHFNQYNNILFYVSELWRTQQTAMIFVNILSQKTHPPKGVDSKPEKPVKLNVIPCNHEFDEKKIKKDWCFKTIKETNERMRKENIRASDRIDDRRNVMFSIDNYSIGNYRLRGGGPRAYVYSYFFVDDSKYDENSTCRKSVFQYIRDNFADALINIEMKWNRLHIPKYTDFEVASRYDYTNDHYTDGAWRSRTWKSVSNLLKSARDSISWSRGGSLNKKKKKKRKTLRRKSKRFTKKRNSRRTNKRRTNKKKRLTNKRRTNKKRFTKRRFTKRK